MLNTSAGSQHELINKGTRMPMYVALQGPAQIPVGKAQNQVQNELKQACKRH